MRRVVVGLVVGAGAGGLDVIPMIIQKLPWAANASAFTMWLVVGILTATTALKLHPAIRGVVVAFMVLAPCAIIIGHAQPFSLLPISIMTLLLGAATGYTTDRLNQGAASRGK